MKKHRTKRAVSQAPFRPQNLLTTGGFIRYCRDNGVSISKRELEELHKEKLLYPAIKVYRGIVELRKIYADFNGKNEWRFVDPKDVKKFKPTKISRKKYYIPGSFSLTDGKWLDWYKKRKMVEFPASQKFNPWDKKIYKNFPNQAKEIENCYEFFYEKFQLLALKIIIKKIKFWKLLNDTEKEKSKKWLRNKIADLYKFLKLYIEMGNFYDRWIKIKIEKFKEYKKIGYNKKQIKKEWRDDFDFDYKPILRKQAKQILKKCKLTMNYLKEWRHFIAQQNIFHEVHRSPSCIKNYLKAIDEKFLIEAEDTNYMIHIINSFIYCLNGEELTVNQIIGNIEGKHCKICGIYFNPIRKGQVTCGDPCCVKENKNRLKRLKRKAIRP